MDKLSNEYLNELVKFGEIDWVINNYVDWAMDNLDSGIINLHKPYLNYIWKTDPIPNTFVNEKKLRHYRWYWYVYEILARYNSKKLDGVSSSTIEDKPDYASTFKYLNIYRKRSADYPNFIRGDKKILALFDKYSKRGYGSKKISDDLLPIQATLRPEALVPERRKLVAEYNPFWLCRNEPKWVIRYMPELMLKYSPGKLIRDDIHAAYRLDPHLVMVVNPYWVATHHFDDILEMRPDLLELLYPKCMDYSLDKLKLILNEHKSTYLMITTLNMEKCNDK